MNVDLDGIAPQLAEQFGFGLLRARLGGGDRTGLGENKRRHDQQGQDGPAPDAVKRLEA
jgi:hypothetical protein